MQVVRAMIEADSDGHSRTCALTVIHGAVARPTRPHPEDATHQGHAHHGDAAIASRIASVVRCPAAELGSVTGSPFTSPR